MKKKNGFVFVETMIVIVILLASLLLIYSSYTTLVANEKRKSRYDDPKYIYRTYNVAKYLLQFKDENGSLILPDGNFRSFNLDSLGNGLGEFVGENAKYTFFLGTIFNTYNILEIYIANADGINEIIENKTEDGNVVFESDTADLKQYLKYMRGIIKDDKASDYYVIVWYSENKNGDSCDYFSKTDTENDKTGRVCTNYFSYVKLSEGGI